jgi:hypothetical protein
MSTVGSKLLFGIGLGFAALQLTACDRAPVTAKQETYVFKTSNFTLPKDFLSEIRAKLESATAPPHYNSCIVLDSRGTCSNSSAPGRTTPSTTNTQIGKARDAIEHQLRTVKGYYNVPKAMRLDESSEIALVIDGTDSAAGLQTINLFAGTATPTSVKISKEASASLTGPPTDVSISLRGGDDSAKKPITAAAPTTWIWDVVPKKRGTVTLTLQVFAWVNVDNSPQPVPFETARWPIVVTATPFQIISAYVTTIAPTWAAIATMLAGIGSLLTWLGFKLRKSDDGTPKTDDNSG